MGVASIRNDQVEILASLELRLDLGGVSLRLGGDYLRSEERSLGADGLGLGGGTLGGAELRRRVGEGLDPVLGNFQFGRPDDGVENAGAEIVLVPRFVVVSPGYAEAALSVLPFGRPCDVLLLLSFQNRLSDRRVVAVRAVSALEGIGGGEGAE